MQALDGLSIAGNSRAPDLALSGTVAQSAIMPAGTYQFMSTVDCYIRIDKDAASATCTTSTGFLLLANNAVPILVPKDFVVAAITSAATGILTMFKVGGHT